MPAAAGGKKAAKAAPSPPGEHPVLGKQIARQFALDPSKPRAAKKWFEGIVEKRVENSKPPLWHVVYDDADSEDLEQDEVVQAIKDYAEDPKRCMWKQGDAVGSHGASHEETLAWKVGEPFFRGVFRTKELEARGQWGMTYYYEDGSITSTIFESREEAARCWDKYAREAGLKLGLNFPVEGETRAIRGRGFGRGRYGLKPSSQKRPGDSAAAQKRKAEANNPDSAKRRKYFLVPVVDPNAPRSTRPKAQGAGGAAGPSGSQPGAAGAAQRPTKGAKGPAAKASGPGSTSAAAAAAAGPGAPRKYKLKLVPKRRGGPGAGKAGAPGSAAAGGAAGGAVDANGNPLSPSKPRLGDSRETCGRLFAGVRQRPNGKWVAMIDLPRPPKPKAGDPTPLVKMPVKETVGYYDTAEEAARAWDRRTRELGRPNVNFPDYSKGEKLAKSFRRHELPLVKKAGGAAGGGGGAAAAAAGAAGGAVGAAGAATGGPAVPRGRGRPPGSKGKAKAPGANGAAAPLRASVAEFQAILARTKPVPGASWGNGKKKVGRPSNELRAFHAGLQVAHQLLAARDAGGASTSQPAAAAVAAAVAALHPQPQGKGKGKGLVGRPKEQPAEAEVAGAAGVGAGPGAPGSPGASGGGGSADGGAAAAAEAAAENGGSPARSGGEEGGAAAAASDGGAEGEKGAAAGDAGGDSAPDAAPASLKRKAGPSQEVNFPTSRRRDIHRPDRWQPPAQTPRKRAAPQDDGGGASAPALPPGLVAGLPPELAAFAQAYFEGVAGSPRGKGAGKRGAAAAAAAAIEEVDEDEEEEEEEPPPPEPAPVLRGNLRLFLKRTLRGNAPEHHVEALIDHLEGELKWTTLEELRFLHNALHDTPDIQRLLMQPVFQDLQPRPGETVISPRTLEMYLWFAVRKLPVTRPTAPLAL